MQKRSAGKSRTEGEPAGAPEMSFEAALERLEHIIDRIESGKVGLEESILEYERGVALLKRCRAVLDRAEQRVAELTTQPPEDRAR